MLLHLRVDLFFTIGHKLGYVFRVRYLLTRHADTLNGINHVLYFQSVDIIDYLAVQSCFLIQILHLTQLLISFSVLKQLIVVLGLCIKTNGSECKCQNTHF